MNIVILVGVFVTVITGLPVLLQMLRSHPKGLIVLFFAEMWERFSYYGMRAILIFYLTQHFLFDDKFASTQYGSYTSLAYLLPLIGGIMADRYLGTRKAILFGALLLVAGHFTMAFEGVPARQALTYAGQQYAVEAEGRAGDRRARVIVDGKPYEFAPAADGGLVLRGIPALASLPAVLPAGSYELVASRDDGGVSVFYLALSLIIMGVGFLKPNISAIVGQLYAKGDPRRDSGFTLYYYGINLGAFWASVLCGLLGQYVGWWAGFGLAGVGMLAGFIAFAVGKPLLQGKGEPPQPARLREPVFGLRREWLIYLLAIAGVGVIWLLVQHNNWVGIALSASTIAACAAIALIVVFVCKTQVERQRMMLAAVLIFGAVMFYMLFNQAGSSINLFTARNVDLSITSVAHVYNVLGLDVPVGTRAQLAAAGIEPVGWWQWIDTGIAAPQAQSFNAGFILIFAPIFAALWAFLGRRDADPNPVLKFGIGIMQLGLGFMVVVWGVGLADASFRMPIVMLGLLYLLHTTGELCISPVGLSQITRLALPTVVSFMMAVWFLSSSIAQYVGGWIASLAGTATVGGQVLNPELALHTTLGVFEKLGWAGIGCGAVFVAVSFFIRHWAHREDEIRAKPVLGKERTHEA